MPDLEPTIDMIQAVIVTRCCGGTPPAIGPAARPGFLLPALSLIGRIRSTAVIAAMLFGTAPHCAMAGKVWVGQLSNWTLYFGVTEGISRLGSVHEAPLGPARTS
jgi:hypothetical protein